MSNVAYVEFGRAPAPASQEARVADVDNGYTRIANELMDELAGAAMTSRQFRVALAVIRKTYGFNKAFDRISDSQLVEITGMPRQKVNKAKHELLEMKVLVMDGHRIGANKVVSDWNITCHHSGDNVTKVVTKSVTKSVTEVSPNRGHTKDTIQKTKDINPLSSQLADARPDPVVKERVIPDAAVQTPNGKSWGTQDDLTAAQWIYQRVLVNNPTQKTPNWPEWANQVRLMRQLDGRSHREMCALFDWASKDAFWCSNVLSPAKLRKHWDTLSARMVKGAPQQASGGMMDVNDTSWIHDDWGY